VGAGWYRRHRRRAEPVLILDTSGLLAALDRRDKHHEGAARLLAKDPGPYVVPVPILAEVTYMMTARLGPHVLDAFLADVEVGAFTLDCGEADVGRIRELVRRYASLPLGFADAAVVACAERTRGPVLTFDVRDFAVVAQEGTIALA